MSFDSNNSKLIGLIKQAEVRLQSLEERLVDRLIEITYGEVGLMHINLDGPDLLGRKGFDRIFYKRRLPSLREFSRLADRLNLDLQVLVLCGRSQSTLHSFKAERGFSKGQLREFLKTVHASASVEGVEAAILKKRAAMIDWHELGRTRLCWRNLAVIFALCGYVIDIKLASKEENKQDLVRRLDYPL